MNEIPVLAVIGGSGLYDMPALKDVETREMDTPLANPARPSRWVRWQAAG